MGRGLGALGLGTGLRAPEQSPVEDVAEAERVPVDLEANNGNGTVSTVRREVASRDGRKMGLSMIAISSIAPNPYQPRKHIDPEILAELADSIREHGLIQPPVVSYNPDFEEQAEQEQSENNRENEEKPASAGDEAPVKERKARYLLVAGERRWQAAKLAGLTAIPVVIKETTPLQMLELALVENIQRADLNPLEEAYAYRQLVSEFGLTQETVAQKVGKSRVAVTNSLRLLALPKQVIEKLNKGEITEGHGRAILMLERIPNKEVRFGTQLRLLSEIITKEMNVREAEEAARRVLRLNSVAAIDAELENMPVVQEAAPRLPRVADYETHELEERLRDALKTKVELSRSKKGGKIIIQFFGDDELDAIFRRIVDFEI